MRLRYVLVFMLFGVGVQAEDYPQIPVAGQVQSPQDLSAWAVDFFGAFSEGDRAAQTMHKMVVSMFPPEGTPIVESVFDGKPKAGPIEFFNTAFDLSNYLGLETEIIQAFTLAYMIKVKERGFEVTQLNWNRLYLASFWLAQLFREDRPVNVKQFASLIGLKPEDVALIIREFLKLIDYKLYLSDEDLKTLLIQTRDEQQEQSSLQKPMSSGPLSPVRYKGEAASGDIN